MHDAASVLRLPRIALVAVLLAAATPLAASDGRWRVLVQGGQASAPHSVRFAEMAGIAAARDFPLTGRLGASAELYPLLVFINRSYHKFKPMEPKRYDNRHYREALTRVNPDVVEPALSDTVAYIVKHLQREGLVPMLAPFRRERNQSIA